MKNKKFTNKLKNQNEFSIKFRELFEDLLPLVSESTFEKLQSSNGYHCHPVKNNETDKIDLIKNVVSELVKMWQPGIDAKNFVEQNLSGEVIWQLGSKGIRIFGIRHSNILDVLFIDYHHLIYSSIKYNEKDFSKYGFGVIEYEEILYE